MVALVGHGSHGRDIEAIWNIENTSDLRIYDANPARGLPLSSIHPSEQCYVGLNNPVHRHLLVTQHGLTGAPALAPRWIGDTHSVKAASGSVIAPGVTMLRDVEIGHHTHVNYAASMTRCFIGDFVTIAPGVTICGDVIIGNLTFVGAGAVICNLAHIGERCTIGAGAVIPPRSVVPDDATVVGVWKQ